jgi:hypothetical protein
VAREKVNHMILPGKSPWKRRMLVRYNERVGGVVARTQPKVPWENWTDPSLTAVGDVEVCR